MDPSKAAAHAEEEGPPQPLRRRRRRRHRGAGQQQQPPPHDDNDGAGGPSSDADGDEGGGDDDSAPTSPLRPPQIDSSPSGVQRATGGRDQSRSPTPGCRSPSRRQLERRVRAAAKAAGRTKKRVLVAIFLVGAVVGAYFIPRLFPKLFATYLVSLRALNISAVLPDIGIDATVNITILNDVWGIFQSAISPETYPGLEARKKGLKAHYPIVLIPGFVTTGLEVWEGEECASSLFRSRLWGTFTMLSTMLMKPDCWAKHMALDPETGLDPPGIRIRPAQGLEAADNFLGSFFWVWSRLIRDFAAIGYDHSNLILASYDWRLSLHDMERRDHYFTILKSRIETLVKINGGRKVVLIAHSYGSNVVVYFMKWVESKQGGGGGAQWVDRHVHTFVNIAGPLLGVIKSATSYISGEMHDTAELGPLEGVLFGTSESAALYRLNRRRLFRTWGSLTAMLPKGGTAVWGNLTHAPDDPDLPLAAAQERPSASVGGDGTCLPVLEDGAFVAPPEKEADGRPVKGQEARGEVPRSFAGTAEEEKAAEAAEAEADGRCVTPADRRAEPVRYGQLIGFSSEGGGPAPRENWTVEDVIKHLQTDPTDPHLRRRLNYHDFGYVADPRRLSSRAQEDRKLWTNPLSVALPKAPNMKVLCFYGVGKPTERAYVYKTDADGRIEVIDTSINDPRRNISAGSFMGDGDGTVSLLSLGYHCSKLWREPTHNPSGLSVTSRELWHTTTNLLSLTRTGGASGDHVDVLGNVEMASELLQMVSGADDGVVGNDRYYSRILEMADKIRLA